MAGPSTEEIILVFISLRTTSDVIETGHQQPNPGLFDTTTLLLLPEDPTMAKKEIIVLKKPCPSSVSAAWYLYGYIAIPIRTSRRVEDARYTARPNPFSNCLFCR